MGLRDINTEISYETSENKKDLLENFYIPVLESSTKYYRVAGFLVLLHYQ